MVTLPSPSQVAKNHALIYEAFYHQVDPTGSDCVLAIDAAAFLKRSGLPDSVLSRIWDLSDPLGNGFLDKQGFFVALKLIALSQNAKDVSMANIYLEVSPPQLACSGRNSPAIDWSVKASEYKKYEEMFNSMGPVGDRLPGHKVKPVMLNSKLPLDVLGKIWDLSDTDNDGFLTKGEFVLAMHLIYKALENIPVPTILPPELAAVVNKRNSIPCFAQILPEGLAPVVESVVVTNSIGRSNTPSSDLANKTTWVVNAIDKAKYDKLFYTLDTDGDGFVTGADVRETLLQSRLTQSVLAHIWNLCDIKQNGKLNSEQFALAMHFVQQGLQGIEIPAALFPEMIPPTLRPKPPSDNQPEVSPLVISGEHESSGSKELDLISSEIKELHMEKMSLEKDIAQKEADVKIKNGELKNLQNELDALETMLKQLEIQKGEARKRLNDLDRQKGSVDLMLCDVNSRMEDETNQVEALKKQKEEQSTNLKTQEHELNSKRQELNDMHQEEIQLETQINNGRQQLNTLNNTLQGTQLQISQMKLKIDQMQEQNRLITDALQQLDAALTSEDFKSISEFTFTAITPIDETELDNYSPPADVALKSENGIKIVTPVTDFEEDPFKSKDPFNNKTVVFASDPFAGEDPFKADPFKENTIAEDPFASDPFQEIFDSKEDPFQGSDPFGSFGVTASNTTKSDPFDPFGLASNQPAQPTQPAMEPHADPFGADPFGPSPIAPPRPESPTPALPPKKSKPPPPRPAPPKAGPAPPIKSGPMRAAPAPPIPAAVDPFKIVETETSGVTQPLPDSFNQPSGDAAFDPFTSSDGAIPNFANFANFDNVK